MSTTESQRSILPLAILTGIAMLATDLFLPAVPFLPQTLGGTIEQAQYTLSGFLASLAFGQLFWGWTSDRFGEVFTIWAGVALLVVGAIACAVAPNIDVLIIARVVQGLGAGAPTVAVPALIRKKFSEMESVKAMGSIASIEAIVPALGPVLGAGLIAIAHWRFSFAVLAVLTLGIAPLLSSIVKAHQSTAAPATSGSYAPLFKNPGFMRFALSYSLMFGTLLLLVMSGPQIIVSWFELPVYHFSILQVIGVAAFIFFVRGGGKFVETKGMAHVIRIGIVTQIVACVCMVLMAAFAFKSFWLLTVLWFAFCAGLALRGPSTFTRALSYAGPIAGKASGLLMFFAFGVCSLSTSAVAPFLEQGFLPLASGMLAMTMVSAALSTKVQSRLSSESR